MLEKGGRAPLMPEQGGIILLKNRLGVRVPPVFGSGGRHPGLAGGGTPNGPGIASVSPIKNSDVCKGKF